MNLMEVSTVEVSAFIIDLPAELARDADLRFLDVSFVYPELGPRTDNPLVLKFCRSLGQFSFTDHDLRLSLKELPQPNTRR